MSLFKDIFGTDESFMCGSGVLRAPATIHDITVVDDGFRVHVMIATDTIIVYKMSGLLPWIHKGATVYLMLAEKSS